VNTIKVRKRAMPSRRRLLVLAAALATFAAVLTIVDRPQPTAAQAADGVKSYIQFSGIIGESADPEHANWSDILSVEQGRSRVTPTVEVVKVIDLVSPYVEWAWADGKHYAQVNLESYKPTGLGGDYRFYKIELRNVTVKNYVALLESGGEPREAFTLRFEKIRVTYRTPTDKYPTPWWLP